MEPYGWKSTIVATTIATGLSLRAYSRKSLSLTGCITAFCVGFCSFQNGIRSGCLLIFFYQVGTMATKYQQHYKRTKDATVETHSMQRGPVQVLACSILAVLVSTSHVLMYGPEQPIATTTTTTSTTGSTSTSTTGTTALFRLSPSHFSCGIIAHYATVLADTLASELGLVMATSNPVLILTPWKSVPPGTNGGITIIGTIWSAIGGCWIGILAFLLDCLVFGIQGLTSTTTTTTMTTNNNNSGLFRYMACYVLFGTLCGLLGSLIDSFLGATIQQTWYDSDSKRVHHSNTSTKTKTTTTMRPIVGLDILTNEQVNLLSVAITTFLGGWILGPILFGY